MLKNYGADNKSALEAKNDAQKIAFAPIVFQAVRTLRNLGILEIIHHSGKHGINSKDISAKLKISHYGVKVLLDAGLSAEVVYLKDNKYFLTKTGFYFISDKMTNINMDFVHDVCYNGMFYLQESVQKEKPEGLKVFGDWATIYHGLSQLPEQVKKSWFAFDHFYSDNVFKSILPLIFSENPARILDIGGNTGKFALECARFNKQVEITIADLPGQLNVALQNATNEGFEGRISGYEIDILNENSSLPDNFDIIWMSQFLDCFSEQGILQILQKAKQSMKENTRLFILETYWDRQNFEAATFSLNNTSLYFTAMANGNSRMYHSNDMISIIEKAGLEIIRITDDLGISHTLIECKK